MSFIVNPLSAMIAMPGLSLVTSRKPLTTNLILTLIRLCYLYNNNAFIYAITSYYCTRTNLRGTYISWMLQIQHFHDFIFEDHCPDFVNDYAS